MDLQTLSDREDIVDLISTYNKASFYCDVKGYADTFSHDGAAGWEGPPTMTGLEAHRT